MVKALGGTLGAVLGTLLGLPSWQLALLAIGVALLLLGVATFVLVWRVHDKLESITRDQEVRVDVLGRKRPDRLKEG
jgi:hypothetical protein